MNDSAPKLGPAPLRLESTRLIFRPFEDRDIETFSAYRSDLEVARYQGWDAPYSLEQAATFVSGMKAAVPDTSGEWYQIALELKATGEMIGDIAYKHLSFDARQAEIGITLARSYHGQGYGLEAVLRLFDYLFGELNLHRVRANCDVLNTPSVHLMERAGMRREAHFVENLFFKGSYSSEYWYAILHREWQALRGQA